MITYDYYYPSASQLSMAHHLSKVSSLRCIPGRVDQSHPAMAILLCKGYPCDICTQHHLSYPLTYSESWSLRRIQAFMRLPLHQAPHHPWLWVQTTGLRGYGWIRNGHTSLVSDVARGLAHTQGRWQPEVAGDIWRPNGVEINLGGWAKSCSLKS